MRLLAPMAVVLALVAAGPAQASHGANVFSGNWTTNIGPLGYAVISESDGASSLQSLGGQPCGAPTVYYRGFYSDVNGSGVIVACERSNGHLVGRYLHEGSQNSAGDGGLDVTYSAPGSFSGHYTADNFPGQTFNYSGTFQAHSNGDGCCPGSGGEEPTQQPPPSQQQVNECSNDGLASIAQDDDLLGAPQDEYCYILTSGPARGEIVRGKVPKVGPRVRELGGEIHFVDDNGARVGPAWVAVEAKAEQAAQLCYMLQFGGFDTPVLAEKEFRRLSQVQGGLAACADATARILARYDQILQKRRSGSGAGAARRGCASRLVRTRGGRRAKPKLRVTCKRTATGAKLTIRPRKSGQTLRNALGTRPPKLFVGRSRLAPPGQVQTLGVWTAK